MKNINRVQLLLIAILLLCVPNSLFSQDLGTDSLSSEKKIKKNLNNTFRINLTNPLLFGDKALIFGYERVLGPRQTISVNIGQTSLPKLSLISFDNSNPDFQVNKDSRDKGINLSVDYRFYLNKLNAFEAPRGVYVAPYYSYNHFERQNTWTLNTTDFQGDLKTNLEINIHTGGVVLGYQFVFWRRVALDFVLLGPGIASYQIKTSLDTSLSQEDESELFDKINDFLAEKFPGYSIVIDDQEYKKSGSSKTTSIGFRYMIHLGVRF